MSAGSFWPTPDQRRLLLAALAEPDEALAAWQELRPRLDLQTLDDASFVTLPLVYRMLEGAKGDEPLLPRLKGIYRSTWVKNALLVDRLRPTAEAFSAAELPVLLVGSIGAAQRYYPSLGLRPTPYVDLLVGEERFLDAVLCLGRSGWTARGPARATSAEPLALFAEGDAACVLRVALAPDCTGFDAFAEHARSVEVGEARVSALGVTEDLLAAIVTGARITPGASIQWVVDAAMILRAAPDEIDWDRLLGLGFTHGQGLRLRDALGYVSRLAGAQLPDEVRSRLNAFRPGRRERLRYACTTRSWRGLGSLPQALAEHLAATSDRSPSGTLAALPAFLRQRWQLAHSWQLPFAAARRVWPRLRRGQGASRPM